MHSLISYSLYSIPPTVIEVVLVLTLLAVQFDAWFAGITLRALVVYVIFTIIVTEWRTQFRRQLNELDSVAQGHHYDGQVLQQRALRSLRYKPGEAAPRPTQETTLSLLNTGQRPQIIATALVLMLWRHARRGRPWAHDPSRSNFWA